MKSALKGQDVLVNTVNTGAATGQKPIIDAAIAAGVKRYVPADYGSFTTDPEARNLQVIAPMTEIQSYIKEKAANGLIEWTLFQTGAFLDMIIGIVPLTFDLRARSIVWYDHGEAEFSATTSTSIGKAIAGALKKPDETKNRVVFVHDIVVTQKKLVSLAKKHVASGPEWVETRVKSRDELERTLDLAKQGKFDFMAGMAQLKAALLSGQYRSRYEKVDNELLGLDHFGEEDLEALIIANIARYG